MESHMTGIKRWCFSVEWCEDAVSILSEIESQLNILNDLFAEYKSEIEDYIKDNHKLSKKEALAKYMEDNQTTAEVFEIACELYVKKNEEYDMFIEGDSEDWLEAYFITLKPTEEAIARMISRNNLSMDKVLEHVFIKSLTHP